MAHAAATEVPGAPHSHREHRDETRARIIETALELFADHGFAATSTREISEHLGFTKAALYYHFRTKDDLLTAIMEPAMQDLATLASSASPHSTPAARRRVVEGYVDLVATHAELIRVVADDPTVRRCEALTAATPLYARLTQLLSGTSTPDTSQRAHVRAAFGAIHAALVRAGPDDDRQAVRQAALAVACSALGLSAARRTRDAPSQ